MSNAATRITEFVLERLRDEPVAHRAALTRDLARIAGSPREAASLNKLADSLSTIEAAHEQLVIDFKKGCRR